MAVIIHNVCSLSFPCKIWWGYVDIYTVGSRNLRSHRRRNDPCIADPCLRSTYDSHSVSMQAEKMSGEAIPMGAITTEPKSTTAATSPAVELSDVNLGRNSIQS